MGKNMKLLGKAAITSAIVALLSTATWAEDTSTVTAKLVILPGSDAAVSSDTSLSDGVFSEETSRFAFGDGVNDTAAGRQGGVGQETPNRGSDTNETPESGENYSVEDDPNHAYQPVAKQPRRITKPTKAVRIVRARKINRRKNIRSARKSSKARKNFRFGLMIGVYR